MSIFSGPRVNAGFVRAATAASSNYERQRSPRPSGARENPCSDGARQHETSSFLINLHRKIIKNRWFSMKKHEKSLISMKKLWKIISDVKISIYIPACRFFVINFHRKIIKNHWFPSVNFHRWPKPEIRARLCNYLRRDEFLWFNFCMNFNENSLILACFFMQLASACRFFRVSISARISTKNHRFWCAFWCNYLRRDDFLSNPKREFYV